MTDKEKIHQILSSLWKNDDSVGKMCYNQALQDVQTAIDLQEEPVSHGQVKESMKIQRVNNTCKENGNSLTQEPVSEELEEALAREWQGYNDRGAATVDALEDSTQELAFAKGFYRGAKWQEDKDQGAVEIAREEIYEWLEKNIYMYNGECEGDRKGIIDELKQAMKDE